MQRLEGFVLLLLVVLLDVCVARGLQPVDSLPAHYDLRQAHPHCVLPVLNEGQWHTTSSSPDEAAELLEALYDMSVASCVRSGRLVDLSYDYVASCCDDCGSCSGASMNAIMSWLRNNGSVNTSCLPRSSGHCPTKCTDGSPLQPVRAQFLPVKGVAQIQQAISSVGPVLAYIDGDALELYAGGILTCKGVSPKLDHVVSIIGWGFENDIPFWIAINSWGENWGENGYFRIERGIDACGIERLNLSPQLA